MVRQAGNGDQRIGRRRWGLHRRVVESERPCAIPVMTIAAQSMRPTFVYDKVSRLTSGQALVGASLKTQSAVFDGFGNITSTTTTDWGTQTFSLDAATNRLNSPVTYL